jgi:anti-sigma regulatory factor (Ser/Thr protein kinase)
MTTPARPGSPAGREARDTARPTLALGPEDREIRAELPASPASARQAREAVRRALAAWGMGQLSDDAELLTSELIANAAEHADGRPISLTVRPTAGPAGQPGLLCEVTDTSPRLPQPAAARPDAERGRGLTIVSALATSSGITARPAGKTAWFTLTAPGPDPASPRSQAEAETEAEAGLPDSTGSPTTPAEESP